MNGDDLQFEEPILQLRRRIEELSGFPDESLNAREIHKLEERLERVTREIYEKLTSWQKVLVARHPARPYTLDYIRYLCSEFVELHGDRLFGDDPAIVGGLGHCGTRDVVVIGHQKGRSTKEKIYRNFGMPRPEGYRKALRLMRLAQKFGRAVVTLIDTPGAYPGMDAEERGQAEAIARNLEEMSRLRVPIVAFVTGEGGSGGALALAVADRVYMLEHAVYSVISPEGCAAILWKDRGKEKDAAEALKLTAEDLNELGIIDGIVPEPAGGAHSDPERTASAVAAFIERALDELDGFEPRALLQSRYEKFRKMGHFEIVAATPSRP